MNSEQDVEKDFCRLDELVTNAINNYLPGQKLAFIGMLQVGQQLIATHLINIPESKKEEANS